MFKSPAQKYISRRVTKCLNLILIWQLQCQVLDHNAICLPTLSCTKVSVTVVHVLAVFSGCLIVCCCSLPKSCWTLQPQGLQHSRLPCPSVSPRVCSNSCPLSQWCHPTILWPTSHTLNISQHKGLFQWIGSSHQMAKVLELQLQRPSSQWIFTADFFWSWLVWSPFSPKDSQDSSAAPQFKSINSLVLSLLYGPLSHPYMTIRKTWLWFYGTLLAKWYLCFSIHCLLVHMASLPRNKFLLIYGYSHHLQWFWSPRK